MSGGGDPPSRWHDYGVTMVTGNWWLVASGWWLVAGGWWLVAGGWWLVAREKTGRVVNLANRKQNESLVSGYKSNNSIWLKSPSSGFLNSFFISSSCKAIFSNG